MWFETAEDAEKYVIYLISSQISNELLWPEGRRLFGLNNFKEGEYKFRHNQAMVTLALNSRRGIGNFLLGKQETLDQYVPFLDKEDERFKNYKIEANETVPEGKIIHAYRPFGLYDFPIAYCKKSQILYIHRETYINYFTLMDFYK